MNKKILVLRAIETLFLLVFTYSISITESSTDTSRGFLSFAFQFRIGTEPSALTFSMYPAGFAVSLLGSLWLIGKVKIKYLLPSIVLAGFGILELISQCSAALMGSFFPFSLEMPLLLCIIDWVVVMKLRKSPVQCSGVSWMVSLLSASTLIILSLAPLALVKLAIEKKTDISAVFFQNEVMAWIQDYDREHFNSVCHSKLVEQTGGQESFDKLWDTIGKLFPFKDPHVIDSFVCLAYAKGDGVIGVSRYVIRVRSSAHTSDIYFKVYGREEDRRWTVSGFNVTDEI